MINFRELADYHAAERQAQDARRAAITAWRDQMVSLPRTDGGMSLLPRRDIQMLDVDSEGRVRFSTPHGYLEVSMSVEDAARLLTPPNFRALVRPEVLISRHISAEKNLQAWVGDVYIDE